MERQLPPNSNQDGHNDGRLHGANAGGVARLEQETQKVWDHIANNIISETGVNTYAIRIKPFAHQEQCKLISLREHGDIVLFGVYGADQRRDRLIGYLLLYSGAPLIHRFTSYCMLSYSEPMEMKTRQVRVIYNDDNVRLLRFGIGRFDYWWLLRQHDPIHYNVDLPDHQVHVQYKGSYKDGT